MDFFLIKAEKYRILEIMNSLERGYIEDKNSKAILYPKYGIPENDLEKELEKISFKKSCEINPNDKEKIRETLLFYPIFVRLLEDENFIETKDKKVFIKSKGREYLSNSISFRFRNHWSFPIVFPVFTTIIGIIVGFVLGKI